MVAKTMSKQPKGLCPICHQWLYRGGVEVYNRRLKKKQLAHKRCAEREIDYTRMGHFVWPEHSGRKK